ncbi:MAG: rhodanese-like domain-containing protein [Ignavibacteriae bacterium]|nr:rhodanese-like domain-containing protein [Ignavibacteriota bacterium]
MSTPQIVLLIIGALIAFVYLRKYRMSKLVKNYSPAELSQALKANSNLVLLDVRSQSERSQNHIKGSLHIPLHELSNRLKELERYKTQEIVCYCLSGSRSLIAAVKLHQQGFIAANLKGGIAEWNFYNR